MSIKLGTVAASGRLPSGNATDREPGSDFEISVANVLCSAGFEVVPQVGVSGFFVDMGVVDPNDSTRFIAGIECDGASYHSSRSARDRDRLREDILCKLGWRLLRVWSTDWFTNPRRERQRSNRHDDAVLC
jgi:very-short-patch-repair endonuclease